MENNKIIDGRAIAADLFSNIKKQVGELKFQPLLCDVVVGDDAVSLSYVKIKEQKALDCSMDFSLVHMPASSTTDEVIDAIKSEQQKENLCGLIVQLPLPQGLDSQKILQAINSRVDVDVINPSNAAQIIPPTSGAILHILDQLPIDLQKENILVLGQGDLVGKPVTAALRARGLEVNTAMATTENKAELLKNATVVITGVGKAGVLKGEEVSNGVVIVDAGTSESGGSILGDVDFETVGPKAKYITPSPGGVGPVTVAKLLENVLKVAQSLG